MKHPTPAKRYPAVIMGTCLIPWTPEYKFDEAAFRKQVRHVATGLTKHLYIFGTAGEGHAVSESDFETITRCFLEEASAHDVKATIGIIHLSLRTIIERIEKVRTWGGERLQISLPAWGALTEKETEVFFEETCGRFPDASFMHYNLVRTKRLITPPEYARLAEKHPNLVATKNTSPDENFLRELLTLSPQLQHFLGEAGFTLMRPDFECGLLISAASTNHKRAHKFFTSTDKKELEELFAEISLARQAMKSSIEAGPHMDGVFDKLYYKLGVPNFPLRLLPPYSFADEETAYKKYVETMQTQAPNWLPDR
ncbi:MAG: dihydrodipicolinate synthase family protein [Chthoniobacterales bacterium]